MRQGRSGRWFSLGTPVSSTNKNDCHDITEILFKVTLNTITLTPNSVKNKFKNLIGPVISNFHFEEWLANTILLIKSYSQPVISNFHFEDWVAGTPYNKLLTVNSHSNKDTFLKSTILALVPCRLIYYTILVPFTMVL